MPAVKIFDELRKKIDKNKGMLPAEKRAMFWFQTYATELDVWQRRKDVKNARYTDLANDYKFTKQVVGANAAFPGCFYFYQYDPKHKMTLPYYDLFPFTLVLSVEKDSFLGLNFHYLDYFNRAMLFDAIYPFREGRLARPDTRDIRMRLMITYDILKASSRYRAFKPCIKRYLVDHVRTPLLKVGAKEWDVALFLPVEAFVKQTKQQVWSESLKKMR